MLFQKTTATDKVFALTKRIRAIAGGSSASKTISILIWLIHYAQQVENKVITITSESYPHLRKGAIRDFQNIMIAHKVWNDDCWVQSPQACYTFPKTNTKIEFTAYDSIGKAHGGRHDILFINECNNVEYEIAHQLILRTKDIVFLDWNPTHEFWFYTELLGKRDDLDFITLTYKDNEALSKPIIEELERLTGNKRKVYTLGELGEIEGRIYTGWNQIDAIPHEARLERYGIDFGYSVDETAIVAIYSYNGGWIVDEVCYQKELGIKQTADIFLNLPKALVIADPSSPLLIDEIKKYGVNIIGADRKGERQTKAFRIQYVQEQRISVTKNSVNLLKEQRSYMWKKDKNGRYLSPNTPEDGLDHLMDALAYGGDSLRPRKLLPANFKPHIPTFNWG